MSLDDLSTHQQARGKEIQAIIINYKKDSSTRKDLQYLEKRLKKLDDAWAEFNDVDSSIRAKYASQTDHPYFAKTYYKSIKVGYEEIRGDIVNRLRRLERDIDDESSREDDTSVALQNDGIPSNNLEDLGHDHNTATLIRRQHAVAEALKRTLSSLPATAQRMSAQYYQVKIRTIERYWEQIETIHYEITEQGRMSFADYNLQNYLELEQMVQDAIIRLNEALEPDTAEIQRPVASPTTASIMRLPKIALPKFDGDYLRWTQFHDLFTEVVHRQPIANCQKMWYLKTSLHGDAEKLVRHLTISDSNYDTAWKIIQDRFQNPRLITSAYLSKLLSQPTQQVESAAAIRALHDTTQECLMALTNQGVSTGQWGPLLLHILLKKLDKTTHGLYEQSLKEPKRLQPIDEFLRFLETRFQSLEALGNKGRAVDDHYRKQNLAKTLTTTTSNTSCPYCKSSHQLFSCSRFLQLTPPKRLTWIRKGNRCVNCLKQGHPAANCPSTTCRKCSKRHNTLLHLEETSPRPTSLTPSNKSTQSSSIPSIPQTSRLGEGEDQSVSLTTQTPHVARGYVILSTVMVTLHNEHGRSLNCRAILDSGSQINFITNRVAKKLQLCETPDLMQIEGIGKRKHQTQRRVNVLLKSRINGFSTRLEAHVLPQIISPQPTRRLNTSSWPIPHNITLADPEFHKPANIDLLIGAEIYFSIMSVGQIKLGPALPILQNTVFGWAVAGKVQDLPPSTVSCGICSEDERLNEQIERFWRLEEPEQCLDRLTSSERRCETFFNETTKRCSNGRFVVRLPLIDDPVKLGESKHIAYQRFLAIERKLGTQEDIKRQYREFMDEYIRLGHMREINFNKIERPYYFLPHHCVIKSESTSTKLRVVFDASAKTSSNISLNDILATGPTLQDDVFTILLRFRMPKFVFTADIEKMFRQIQMEEADQKYQLIWWREDPSQRLKCFQLSTVTYGTSSAPYLATKCLQKLAHDNADSYPLGSEVLARDFYVDDLLTGSNSLSTALEIQKQLQLILESGGFKLRKWCANHPHLLRSVPEADREVHLDFGNKTKEHIKRSGYPNLIHSVSGPPGQTKHEPQRGQSTPKSLIYSILLELWVQSL